NSANIEQWDEVYAEISAGQVDVLLVSPERLNNPSFRDLVLPKLIASAGLLVVDEAHCISDWGHDFRPDYRRLRTLLAELPPDVPVLATTATANARVVADVVEQLAGRPPAGGPPGAGAAGEGRAAAETSRGGAAGGGSRGEVAPADGTSGGEQAPADGATAGGRAVMGEDGHPLVLRGPLDRESLHLAVVRLRTAEQRLAWLVQHLPELPGSGIVYTLTVAAANELAAHLRDSGVTAVAYTGQTDPDERRQAEADLLANRVKAVVATSALGMGYDKPDLGFVVHFGAPQSPVAYYQQIGRAGRGVRRAEVILLPGPEDRDIWAYFGSLAFPPEKTVRATLAA